MKKWHVQQLGSREAYLYPRLLHDLGLLETFSTDIWVPSFGQIFYPKSLNRLKNRYHPSLKDIPIYSKNLHSIFRMIKPYYNNKYDNWLREGALFSEWSWHNISKSTVNNECVTFGYSISSLESLTFSKKKGATAILGQVDPGLYWYEILKQEYLEWLGYFPKDINPTDAFKERIQAEWDIADKIIVNSIHSRESLIKYGVDFSKIEILPLPVNYKPNKLSKELPKNNETIRIIFVGNISLAKGFQYFAEAQKKLGSKYEFIAIGDLHLPKELFTKYSWNINLTGRVNKNQLMEYYSKASLLVFPTLSDGFGQVQLEALSFGLPVIATENCANVVTSGIDGEIVPIRNVDAIVDAILKITTNKDTYKEYSMNALKKIEQYNYNKTKLIFKDIINKL